MSEMLAIGRQMQLLLEYTPEPNTRPSSIAALADVLGLTQQTLQNILHGRIDNPRLNTLKALCQFYGISLDYFDLQSEDQCRHYLAAKQLKAAPPVIQQIDHETQTLTGKAQNNILSALEWMTAAFPSRKP